MNTCAFQSPFRRGMECYDAEDHLQMREGELSVPFSSGHGVLLLEMVKDAFVTVPFSPLFVGAWSATLPAPRHGHGSIFFQSPFRRGMECYMTEP